MTVGMGHECPGQAEDAGIAHKRPVSQLGQLTVEAWRQVVANFADLRLDQVVVV